MAVLPRPLDDPETRVAFDKATRWLRMLARVGYASKGIVYIVMGLLAARAAMRVSSDVSSFRGSLLRIVDKPFGHTMLALLAIGFAGYAAWQILSAAIDAEDAGEGRKALMSRTEQLFVGLIYLGLAKISGHLLFEGEPTSVEIENHWGTWLLLLPQAHVAVMVVGIGIIGYGGWQFWRARSERTVLKRVTLPATLQPWARTGLVNMGRFGFAARGVVFAMLGWLVMQAGLHHEAMVAANLGDAQRALGGGPQGSLVLGVVAVGLIAHGGYQFVNARYRRLRERRLWKLPRRGGGRKADRRSDASLETRAPASDAPEIAAH